MDNSMALGANGSAISRKRFLASSAVAVVVGGFAAEKPLAAEPITGSLMNASEGIHRSKSFTGTLDALGQMVFPHGLGSSLPANILSVSAFIKLPDGKVRNISVQYVDDTSIAIAAGVPNAAVRVGVVYSKDGAFS